MNEFAEKYKTLSNPALFKILHNQSGYQPLAVEAAKQELENRQLSEKEREKAKAELEIQELEVQRKDEKRKVIEAKVKKSITSFADTFQPRAESDQSMDREIKLTSIVFAGLSVYQLYRESDLFWFMFTDSSAGWDFSVVFYFLPIIMLPLAIVLFWKRKKTGWLLLSIYITFSVVLTFILFLANLNREPSGIPAIDNLIPETSSLEYIGTILFFAGFLWLICKDHTRQIYKIDKKSMFAALAITGLLTALIGFGMV